MFNLGLEAIQLNRIRTMYHSSPIENLDSILTKGLIINSETTYEGFLKPIVKGVYVSTHKTFFLGNALNMSKKRRAIIITCKIQYTGLYVDEDEIIQILARDIPSVFFSLATGYKKYNKKANILKLLDILDDIRSINKVWCEFTTLVPGILKGLEKDKEEILRSIYTGFICQLLNSRSGYIKKLELSKVGLEDHDIARVMNLLTSDIVKRYRTSLYKLVVNSSSCIDSFIEISKKYDQRRANVILAPISFISPKQIAYDNLPYIAQIDVYKFDAKHKAEFVENVYINSLR